jgi:hypothetical protein
LKILSSIYHRVISLKVISLPSRGGSTTFYEKTFWFSAFGGSGLCQPGIHGHQSIADRAGELLEEETPLIDIVS